MKKLISCLMLLLAFSTTSYANDNRIKTITYKPNEVVTLHGTHLIATGILFSDAETIISAKVGDALAWLIEASQNTLYVKPILPNSDTNLLVTTNLRNYQFHLKTSLSANATSKNTIYLLKFQYEDEKKSSLAHELEMLQQGIPDITQDASQWNEDYSFAGSKEIAPIAARDNGKFTVFKFRKQSDIPAIFLVDNHRNEQLVNFHVQGNDVFIQGVHHQYTFRRGEEVTSVYNDHVSNT